MNVYNCGIKAVTVIGKIEGIITGICIRFNKTQYELAYFKDGKHYTEWLAECELKFDKSLEQTTIGFKTEL